MLIYRFETIQDRKGIYAESDAWWQACRVMDVSIYDAHQDETHPAPARHSWRQDHALVEYFNDHMYCGFISLDQLRAWFTAEQVAALYEVGCQVYVYEAHESFCHASQYQAIFYKAEAHEIVAM